MNIMKRFLLLWILSMAIMHVSAYDFEEGGIYYNILPDGLSVEVTAGDEKYNAYGDQFDIVIPEKVGHNGKQYTVTAIGRIAFYQCGDMGTIDLPATINTFGSSAFRECYFKKVFIHDLTAYCNIDNKGTMPPFYNYHNEDEYKKPKFASGLLLLNNEPVRDLSTLDNNCKQIPDYAFYGQSTLEDATLPDSVKNIGKYAFNYCKKLKKISIGNKVQEILAGTFTGCSKIKNVILREGNAPLIFDYVYELIYSNGNNIDYKLYAFDKECVLENLYLGRYVPRYYKNYKYDSRQQPFEKIEIKNVICNTPKGVDEEAFPAVNNKTWITNYIVGPKATNCYTCDLSVKRLYWLTDALYTGQHIPDSMYVLNEDNVQDDVKKWYPDRIKTLIDIQGFDLQNGAEFEYGDTPDITTSALVNHVPDMQAEINVAKSFGAGKHTEGLPITLSNDIWTAEIFYPWSYTVDKAPLTVIADNMELPYGSEKKDFTVSYFGFKNGEDESVLTKPVTISTTAKTDSPVGTYPIIPFGGYADNYTLSYERGVLSIVKAEQTIEWKGDMPDEATVGTKIKLEATASSGLPVSFKSSDNGVAGILVVDGEYYLNCKKAGEVEITACQVGNKNYESAADEVRSLTVMASTGIEEVESVASGTEKVYDVSGNVLKKCQRGVNIVRRSDGTAKKVVVK